MGFKTMVQSAIKHLFGPVEDKGTLDAKKSKLDERRQPSEPKTPKKVDKKVAVSTATSTPKRTISDETRKRLSEAAKAAHARRKAEAAAKEAGVQKKPSKKVAVKASNKTQKVAVKKVESKKAVK